MQHSSLTLLREGERGPMPIQAMSMRIVDTADLAMIPDAGVRPVGQADSDSREQFFAQYPHQEIPLLSGKLETSAAGADTELAYRGSQESERDDWRELLEIGGATSFENLIDHLHHEGELW